MGSGRDEWNEALTALTLGEIKIEGRIPWSSNATFLVALKHEGSTLPGIYKPARGERPLRDFPMGLWRREVAAYQLDRHLGWGLVPPTAARLDAPLGAGSIQYCVPAVPAEHYFTLLDQPSHRDALKRIAAYDLVANNADRKSGHCLLDTAGHVWAIDNALCFHSEPKLRTVLWDFAGERVDDELLGALAPLARGEAPAGLASLLKETEIAALCARSAALVRSGHYPEPIGRFPYPWPLV
ncbi:MAG TPA: SCO1664 family protein [Acidimicrobiales bacterium]|nr:SCO1664 family protein [Acidimicrobiales bacterium]